MNQYFFWNNWEYRTKLLYQSILAIFFVSIAYAIVSYATGHRAIFDWELISLEEPIKVEVNSFKKGLFQFSTWVENYVLTQRMQGSELKVNVTAAWIILIQLLIGITVSLTLISTLPRFWYLVGMVIFIAFMVNLRMENLAVFGLYDKTALIISFVIFLPSSYYFHAINPNVDLFGRLARFAGLVALFGIIIAIFSQVSHPVLYLINYGIFGPLLITVVFILMISHEIVNGFLYLITYGNNTNSKHSFRHFVIISGIYLTNLILLYLDEIHLTNWGIHYIDPFLLLLISTLVGIWGLIRRSEILKGVSNHLSHLSIFYLTLAIISWGTISYFMATGNDPILEVVKDTIIYGHLGFGLIFFLYIISNFSGMLNQNHQVYRIVYKPQTMPYFTFRFAGLIVVAALVLKEDYKVPIYFSLSGYYNGIGDLFTANDEYPTAEAYYKYGRNFGYQNHRSNYALAYLSEKQEKDYVAKKMYKDAIKKRPSAFAYVNLSNIYLDEGMFFDALFTLSEGLEKFPNNGPILNNMGVVMGKTSILDSSLYFLDLASKHKESRQAAATNYLALIAKNHLDIDIDSLYNLYYVRNSVAFINNFLLLKNMKSENLSETINISDSILNTNSFVYLINSGFNNLKQMDTTDFSRLRLLAEVGENSRYREIILRLLAFSYYENNRIYDAFTLMENLAGSSLARSGYYYNTLGVWAMEQEVHGLAIHYFNLALNSLFPESFLNRAVAYLEVNDLEQAKLSWEKLQGGESKEAALQTLKVLNIDNLDSILSEPDNLKYQWLRYRIRFLNDELINLLIENFENENYKARIYFDIVNIYYHEGRYTKARNYYQRAVETSFSDPSLKEELAWFDLKLLVIERKMDLFQTKYNTYNEKYELKTAERRLLGLLFEALIEEMSGNMESAKLKFKILGKSNPFDILTMRESARFFNSTGDGITAYDILVIAYQFNPTSIPLAKAYVIQCYKENFDTFAESVLKELKNRLELDEFEEFRKEAYSYQQEVEWEVEEPDTIN